MVPVVVIVAIGVVVVVVVAAIVVLTKCGAVLDALLGTLEG